MFIQTLALEKWEPAGRIGDLAKSPRILRSSWILIWALFVLQNCEIVLSIQGLYDKNNTYYRQRRQLVTRWSRSSSNFYAVIGQNLTGEFMRKIYAAS